MNNNQLINSTTTNMKKTVFSLAVLALAAFTISSCTKKNSCTAGASGAVTIAAFPKHHGEDILSKASYPDTVFLKFNTKNSPGTNLAAYDKYFVGEVGEDHVHMAGLSCGDYYIFAVGFDSTINQRVTGGIPFSFTQTSGEIDLNIPVVE